LSDDRDLFGRKIKRRKSPLEYGLAKHDASSFEERLVRLKWLTTVIPTNVTYMMPSDTFYVFGEVKNAFVAGAYVATVLLCTSFIEHWLSTLLAAKGFEKESRSGLKTIVKCLRKQKIGNDYLIENVDKLRRLRNPFVHLKPFDHAENLSQRSYRQAKHPVVLLEEDAKLAISLMYAVAMKL
jgi:hypothetical protein